MKVLLLEKIKRLGNVGDLVVVSSGFARNYLFLRKKALRLTNENEEKFKREKAKIEQVNEEKKSLALQNSKIIEGKTLIIIRQSGEDGRLYGSVNKKDIVKALNTEFNITCDTEHIILKDKIKKSGFFRLTANFYPEIESNFNVNIARSIRHAKNVEVLNNKKHSIKN